MVQRLEFAKIAIKNVVKVDHPTCKVILLYAGGGKCKSNQMVDTFVESCAITEEN